MDCLQYAIQIESDKEEDSQDEIEEKEESELENLIEEKYSKEFMSNGKIREIDLDTVYVTVKSPQCQVDLVFSVLLYH